MTNASDKVFYSKQCRIGLCCHRKKAGDTQMAKMLSLIINLEAHDTVRWR